MRRYHATAEVCPACLTDIAEENPACETCGPGHDDYRAIELTAVGEGFVPANPGCTWGPPERCYPPEGAEFRRITVTRSDTGAEVSLDDLPESVARGLVDDLVDRAEDDDSAICAAEDRADAERERDWS